VPAIVTAAHDADGNPSSVPGIAQDQAERPRPEASLRQSEDWCRSIVAVMADGVVVQRADGSIVSSNESASRILGLDADQLQGLTPLDPHWTAVHEDGSPFLSHEHPSALSLRTGQAVRDVVMGVQRPDGARSWISASSVSLREHSGADAPAVVTCFTDITALTRSRDTARRLLDFAPEATLGIAADGRIVLANRRAEAVFGAPRAELEGMAIQELLPGELTATETDGTGRRAERRDGQGFSVEIRLAAIDAVGDSLTLVSVRDLTELDAARVARDRVFEVSVDMICTAGGDGFLKSANPGFERVLGWSEQEMLATPFLSFVHPDDAEATLARLRSQIQGEVVTGFTNRYRCRDGSYRWLRWNASPVTGTGLIYATADDITERIEQEEALRELSRSAALLASLRDGIIVVGADRRVADVNPRFCEMTGFSRDELIGAAAPLPHWPVGGDRPRLETVFNSSFDGRPSEIDVEFRRADGGRLPVIVNSAPFCDADGRTIGIVETVKDATGRIDRMKDEIRVKDELISVVSHELRTPLTSVYGAIGLLSEMTEPGSPGERILQIAKSNTERLVRMINDMLDLERLSSGKETLTIAEADTALIVRQAAEMVRNLAEEADVELAVGSTDGLGTVPCDIDRVAQVLTNYLGNAIKFSPKGGRVELTCDRRPGLVRFEVSDQGQGIPADQLERIFERFHQVDSSDRRQAGGTGLGLTISRHIADQHGGRAWAESELGVGSHVYLDLPDTVHGIVPQPEPQGDGSAIATTGEAPGGPWVLVVEDDSDLAQILRAAFERHGIRVERAGSGRAAIARIGRSLPTLIVLDIQLPDGDGFAVSDSLRAGRGGQDVPVLACTKIDLDDADRARLQKGPFEVLTKSRVSPAEFERRVISLFKKTVRERSLSRFASGEAGP
jgi:PAS domain S-box-containing protein